LVEINREVGTRQSELKGDICEINLNLDFEKLQPELKKQLNYFILHRNKSLSSKAKLWKKLD
jgi:hypothetical protein